MRSSHLGDLQNTNRQLRADMSTHIATVKSELLEGLKQLQKELIRQQVENDCIKQQVQNVEESLAKDGECVYIEYDVLSVATKLSESVGRANCIATALCVLKKLWFRGIDIRYRKIADAHPKSCQRVFADKLASFLRSDKSLFWISGKPGSGKSTLMKFLVNNQVQCMSSKSGLVSGASWWPVISFGYLVQRCRSLRMGYSGQYYMRYFVNTPT
jgi:DNA replication protein DnaC